MLRDNTLCTYHAVLGNFLEVVTKSYSNPENYFFLSFGEIIWQRLGQRKSQGFMFPGIVHQSTVSDCRRLTILVPCSGLVTLALSRGQSVESSGYLKPAALTVHLRIYNYTHVPSPNLSLHSPVGCRNHNPPLPTSTKATLFSFSSPKTPRTETKWKLHSVIICTLTEKFMTLCKKYRQNVVCWELKIRRKACYWQHLPWVTLERGWIIGCSWGQPPPLLLLETAKENQLFVALQQEEMIKQINFEFTQCQVLLYGLDTRGCLWRDFPCPHWDPEPLSWHSCSGRLASGLVFYHPSPYCLPSPKHDSVYKTICVLTLYSALFNKAVSNWPVFTRSTTVWERDVDGIQFWWDSILINKVLIYSWQHNDQLSYCAKMHLLSPWK